MDKTYKLRLEDGHKQLIPGISDDVTLFQIVPKLPWKTFYILSAVNSAWLHKVRDRQVYDARVISHSAETLLLEDLCDFKCLKTTVTLRSPQDDFLAMLPQIPYQGNHYHWVPFDGKIYLLGGHSLMNRRRFSGRSVFVFDVAGGQGQWKKCASMNERREYFACGAMHGKLYVFGGVPPDSYDKPPTTSCVSEVYDVKKDIWSPIRPMTTLRYRHRVEPVGDELFVLGGSFYDPDIPDLHWKFRSADFLEAYHPLKDEWRVVNLPNSYKDRFLFVAWGKLYSMGSSSIDLYDSKENLFMHLHSFSMSEAALLTHPNIIDVVAAEHELVVRVTLPPINRRLFLGDFQTIGFGSGCEELVLQRLAPLKRQNVRKFLHSLIQL